MRLRQVRWRRPVRGQSLVETAIVLPAFLLLVLGVLEGGLIVFRIATMSHAVHEGARKAALPGTPSIASVQATVLNAASFVAAPDITVQVSGSTTIYADRKTGDRIKVTAKYVYSPISSMVLNSATITLTRQAEIMAGGLP